MRKVAAIVSLSFVIALMLTAAAQFVIMTNMK